MIALRIGMTGMPIFLPPLIRKTSPQRGGGVGVRVELPTHLRALAGVEGELVFPLGPGATLADLFDALEARHPRLRGTIRHHDSGARRAYMRYFAERADLSHASPDEPLTVIGLTPAHGSTSSFVTMYLTIAPQKFWISARPDFFSTTPIPSNSSEINRSQKW